MIDIRDKIELSKIVPVIAVEKIDHVLPLADALIEGGLPLLEITFRTKIAPEAILLLKKKRPEMMVGAGTILTLDELKSAIDNGAEFGVAPGFNPKIVEESIRTGFPFMPGVMTPSEIEAALSFGLKDFKFFPAEAAGGISYLKSISAPFNHRNIRFIPTGGINIQNLKTYLELKEVIAVGGTWLAKNADFENAQWELIVNKCRAARKIISE